MSDLKPCPFCGCIPKCGVEFCESSGAEVILAAAVECTMCGIKKRKIFKATNNMTLIPFWDYEKAFASVVQDWNTRAKMEVDNDP